VQAPECPNTTTKKKNLIKREREEYQTLSIQKTINVNKKKQRIYTQTHTHKEVKKLTK
jgi:hypothetical protein